MAKRYGIALANVTKSFSSNGNGKTLALQDVTVRIRSGEFVVVAGPNGSGKTTLLNCLAGEYAIDDGTICLEDELDRIDWTRLAKPERARHIARVHQDPRMGTVPLMTVWENFRLAVAAGRFPSPLRLSTRGLTRGTLIARLSTLGLEDKVDCRVSELSQGQRQLLAVELALLREPDILLLDEHTASLDQSNARRCLDATVRLSSERKTTVLMVTHNLLDAMNYGDRLLVMRDGRIHADITGEERRTTSVESLIRLCGYVA
jgi:putative ABC transport system ATP-binding protein